MEPSGASIDRILLEDMIMKALHTIPYIGNEASGPAYSTPRLCSAICDAGVEVELHVLAPKPQCDFNFTIKDYPRHRFPTPKLGRSPEMREGVYSAAKDADIIHNHSFWMFPNVYGENAIARLKRQGVKAPKLVNAPRGTLSQWALQHHCMNKKMFDVFARQYAAMRATDMWHATAVSEYDDIRRQGFRQPVMIIPNGIDMVDSGNVRKLGRRRIYFLSRIHPTKNLELLIRCWSQLERDFRDWDLSVVGPDNNNQYADKMKKLTCELGCKRVTFEGLLSGEVKRRFVCESEVMVLPTHSENFGMVVAEALSNGVPVICTKGAPWQGLETNNCGKWIDDEEDVFLAAMHEMMSKSREELSIMGARGRKWMERAYSWRNIGEKMKVAYEWLLNGGDVPEWVKID